MDMAIAARQRAIVQRMALLAQQRSSATTLQLLRMRGELITTDEDRKALVGLIEEMVASDAQLADVAPSVGALLRSAIAADAVTATFLDASSRIDLEDAYSPDDLLRIGRVRGQAEAAILAEPMLDAAGVAQVLGSRSSNPREYARSLRQRPGILALQVGNRFVFPAFQFNEARHTHRPLVAEVNQQLGAHDDPWGVASWWFSADPTLGARPADLATDSARDEELRAAVARELAPVG